VAVLIYDVDYRTFKHVFKSKEEGVEAIKNRLLLIDFADDAEVDENDLFYVFFDDEDKDEKEKTDGYCCFGDGTLPERLRRVFE
jgi:hypothetical protein